MWRQKRQEKPVEGCRVSHYLNAVTDSAQRATVLSFKGLVFNLGYGTLGLLYAGLLAMLRGSAGSPMSEEGMFQASLPWLLGYGVVACLLFAVLVVVSGNGQLSGRPATP